MTNLNFQGCKEYLIIVKTLTAIGDETYMDRIKTIDEAYDKFKKLKAERERIKRAEELKKYNKSKGKLRR